MANDDGELPAGVIGERRQGDRVAVELGCQAVTDDDFFLLGDRIADLSLTGMLLRSDGIPADVGEVVLVSFRPPKSDHFLDVRGRVVRLLNGNERGAPGFGLSIEGLNAFDREVLKAALERTKRPARRRRRKSVDHGRGRYTDPDAVAVRPLVRVFDGVTALPRWEDGPRSRSTPRVPKATFGGVVEDAAAAKSGPSREQAAPGERGEAPAQVLSLWRAEPEASTEVVPARRATTRRLPRARLQSPEPPPRVPSPTRRVVPVGTPALCAPAVETPAASGATSSAPEAHGARTRRASSRPPAPGPTETVGLARRAERFAHDPAVTRAASVGSSTSLPELRLRRRGATALPPPPRAPRIASPHSAVTAIPLCAIALRPARGADGLTQRGAHGSRSEDRRGATEQRGGGDASVAVHHARVVVDE